MNRYRITLYNCQVGGENVVEIDAPTAEDALTIIRVNMVDQCFYFVQRASSWGDQRERVYMIIRIEAIEAKP